MKERESNQEQSVFFRERKLGVFGSYIVGAEVLTLIAASFVAGMGSSYLTPGTGT